MRRAHVPASVIAIALLLLLAPACDSDQPLGSGEKDFTLSMEATVRTPVYEVWDWTEDANGDGDLDLDEDSVVPNGQLDAGVWCQNPEQPDAQEGRVPFFFSLQVDVIRAGSTDPETLYSSAADPNPFSNMTGYQEQPLGPAFPAEMTRTLDSGPTLQLTNGRRLTQGSADLLQAPIAFSNTPGNVAVCLHDADQGPPRIAGGPPPLRVRLGPGDTVRVQARKLGSIIAWPSDLSLIAHPALGGVPVVPSGSTVSVPMDTAGVSFYVTQR